MDAHLFAAVGLLAVGMIVWQAWRERAVERRRIPADWLASIERMSREQSQGHHRQVRSSLRPLSDGGRCREDGEHCKSGGADRKSVV